MLSPLAIQGTWRLARRVLDRKRPAFGRMTGTLTLSETSRGVRWYERGRFEFAGNVYDSSRELLLRYETYGNWTMCFADGREFHPWQPGQIVEHPCGDDVYLGLVDVGATRLRTIWDVTGPAKDQRIVTRCYRS